MNRSSSEKRRRFLLCVVTVAVLTASGSIAAHAEIEPLESAGAYVWECVLPTGSSYVLQPGQPLSSCTGSRLKQYLYGTLKLSIPLTGEGTVANPNAANGDCLIALVGNSMLFFMPIGDGFAVVADVAGLWSLKSCIA